MGTFIIGSFKFMSEYILVYNSFAQNVRKYAQGKRIYDKNHVFEKGCDMLWEEVENCKKVQQVGTQLTLMHRNHRNYLNCTRRGWKRWIIYEMNFCKLKMRSCPSNPRLQLCKPLCAVMQFHIYCIETNDDWAQEKSERNQVVPSVKPSPKKTGTFLKQSFTSLVSPLPKEKVEGKTSIKSPRSETRSPLPFTSIPEKKGKYFGVDISTLDPPVPVGIEGILSIIEERYLKVEGIFGSSGRIKDIELLKQKLEDDIPLDQICKGFDMNSTTTAHDFAGVIKLWFRSMKEPIFGFENFVLMCHLADTDNYEDLIQCVSELINLLPKNHKICLERIMSTLHLISFNSKANGMTYQKISHSFSNSILRPPPSWSPQEVADKTQSVIRVMRAVFMNSVKIFHFDDMDQLYSIAGSTDDEDNSSLSESTQEYQRPDVYNL
jgi:hypothetical protein